MLETISNVSGVLETETLKANVKRQGNVGRSHNRRVDVTIEDEAANAGSASLVGGIGEFVLKSLFQERQMDRLSLKNNSL